MPMQKIIRKVSYSSEFRVELQLIQIMSARIWSVIGGICELVNEASMCIESTYYNRLFATYDEL